MRTGARKLLAYIHLHILFVLLGTQPAVLAVSKRVSQVLVSFGRKRCPTWRNFFRGYQVG